MKKEVFRMERVTFQEKGTTPLENFNLIIRESEIMGLVPINHIGLDALLRLFRQNLPLHYGYIYYQGKLVNHWRYSTMKYNRISLIQNESCLAGDLTVADNVFVLRNGFKKWLMRPKILQQQLEFFTDEIGVEISGDTYVDDLSPFERFVVELLKAVVSGSRLIVLEDIGAFIGNRDLERLHEIFRYYSQKGISFLYIAGHMEDAWKICERVALMANGQIIKYYYSDMMLPRRFHINESEDYERHVLERTRRHKKNQDSFPVFELVNVNTKSIRNMNLALQPGECVVLQAMDSAVFSDMVGMVSEKTTPLSGSGYLDGDRMTSAIDRRLGVIQEFPIQSMLFSNMSYMDNLCITLDHRFPEVWSKQRVRKSIYEEYSPLLGADCFYSNVNKLTEMQKYDLIYTRILLQNPRAVICIQPFKRAEVGLRLRITEHLERFLDKGIGVLIVAVNLADTLTFADRLICVARGKEPVEYRREEFGTLPIDVPWRHLYREDEEEPETDEE